MQWTYDVEEDFEWPTRTSRVPVKITTTITTPSRKVRKPLRVGPKFLNEMGDRKQIVRQRKQRATKALHQRETAARTAQKAKNRLKSLDRPTSQFRKLIRDHAVFGRLPQSHLVLPSFLPGVSKKELFHFEKAILSEAGYVFEGANQFAAARNKYNKGILTMDLGPIVSRFQRDGSLPKDEEVKAIGDAKTWATKIEALRPEQRRFAQILFSRYFDQKLLRSGDVELNPGPPKRNPRKPIGQANSGRGLGPPKKRKRSKKFKHQEYVAARAAFMDSLLPEERAVAEMGLFHPQELNRRLKNLGKDRVSVPSSPSSVSTSSSGVVTPGVIQADAAEIRPPPMPVQQQEDNHALQPERREPLPVEAPLPPKILDGYQFNSQQILKTMKPKYSLLYTHHLEREVRTQEYEKENRLVTHRNVAVTQAPILFEKATLVSSFRFWILYLPLLLVLPLTYFSWYPLFSLVAFLPAIRLLEFYYSEGKIKTYIWSPHMVSCIFGELSHTHTNETTIRSSAYNVARRTCTLPIDSQIHSQVLEGSVEMAVSMITQSNSGFIMGHHLRGQLRPDLMVT